MYTCFVDNFASLSDISNCVVSRTSDKGCFLHRCKIRSLASVEMMYMYHWNAGIGSSISGDDAMMMCQIVNYIRRSCSHYSSVQCKLTMSEQCLRSKFWDFFSVSACRPLSNCTIQTSGIF